MQSISLKVFAFSIIILASCSTSYAQETKQAWPGPKGVFLFTGNSIPSGTQLSAYLVERSDASGNWVKVEEVKLPGTFQLFMDKVNQSKAFFPDQPLPAQSKMEALYKKAQLTGTVDSLSGWKNYPVRMALGVMCYDDKVIKGTFRYRITQLDSGHKEIASVITNEVKMPYKAVFDSIRISESSRTAKINYIKWFSAGENPAPLFQPFKYENGKSVSISGWTGRTKVNDTTYYSFTDSVAGPVSAEQYFIIPYDPFGNAGSSSEILKVSPDLFSRTKITRVKASRIPDRYGIKVSWYCNTMGEISKLSLFRSESKEQGYSEYAILQPGDTVYYDVKGWPGHTYHYFLKAYDSTGRRFITSDKASFKAELPRKPKTPQLTAKGVRGGVEVTATSSDDLAEGIRIFRCELPSGKPVAISELLLFSADRKVVFTDTSENLSGRMTYAYQARSETKGLGVSELSEKAEARPLIDTPPADPAFVRAGVKDNVIDLIWQDVRQSDTSISAFVVTRKEISPSTGALGKEGQVAKTGNIRLEANTMRDSLTSSGYSYSYTIYAVDKLNRQSPGGCRLIISLAANNPIPPDYIRAKRSDKLQPLVLIEWADVMFDGFSQYKLFKQFVGEEPQLIATLKPGTTRYSAKLESGKPVASYFIKTVHSSGAESIPSKKAKPE